MATYTLSNAEDLNRENPLSFDIPSRDKRGSLEQGDTVKLIFDSIERMWVDVTEVTETGYVGLLANIPSGIKTIVWGGEVEFGPEHIIEVADRHAPRAVNEMADNLRIVSEKDNVNKPSVLH